MSSYDTNNPFKAVQIPEEQVNWRVEAACRDEDPELFFPIGEGYIAEVQTNRAKAVCRGCGVIDSCLKENLNLGAQNQAGVAAGLTEKERRTLIRRMSRNRV